MIKVTALVSISYTGTTWINYVLTNNPGAVYLGPPDRSWKLMEEHVPHACLLHRSGSCAFWNKFYAGYDRNARYLPQFSAATGARHIFIANPTPAFRTEELELPDVEYREIIVLRDGRGIIESFRHHVPTLYPDVATIAEKWLRPACRIMLTRSKALGDRALVVRYEDVAADPVKMFEKMGEFVGLSYDASSLEYWKQEAHPTAGNIGTTEIIARFRDLPEIRHSKFDEYQKRYEALRSNPRAVELDESWRTRFTDAEKESYKTVMGEIHEQLGYSY